MAIPVNPAGVAGSTSAHVRARPAAALSAFLNPLVISLVGLLPDNDVSIAIVVIAITSAAATIGSIIYLLVEARTEGIRRVARTILSLSIQLATYLTQVLAGLHLHSHPDRPGPVSLIAICVIVLFGTGIDRAWEFVGAHKVSLIGSVADAILGHDGSSEQQPSRQGEPKIEPVPTPESDSHPEDRVQPG